ncbi:helix-turn-helix domain-containing protein [Bartonella apihabitans]|uniref:helix-turn-helix domain-containing protein n=1 Tax=Bartonella apihabitans TaxID=2750929 RepID=UPI003BB71774
MSSYSHSSFAERTEIHYLPVSGYSLNAIVKRLSYLRSTIGREISRNRLTSIDYSPLIAKGR